MSQQVKSPFVVVQDFISPLLCERIIDATACFSPDTDIKGKPIRTVKHNQQAEQLLMDRLSELVPSLESHYGFDYKGTEPMNVEWFPEGSEGPVTCESSSFIKKKWVKTKDREFSGVIFLNDYQDRVPFDDTFEVYGGKLEFPQWGFGFNPQRGTLIIYPSGPHFINKTSPILVGDLYQVKIHMASHEPFLFNLKNFPGDYTNWFKDTV